MIVIQSEDVVSDTNLNCNSKRHGVCHRVKEGLHFTLRAGIWSEKEEEGTAR